jgi:hypothetical protein
VSLRADLKPALTITWLIVSGVMAIAAAAPFVLPAELLYGVFPECPSRLRGNSCALCGMTTAWVHIASGDVASAQRANAASVPLWTITVLNFVVAVAYSMVMLRRRRHRL